MRTVKAAPKASLLIESMRDVGYSLETALADIIDNSITAKASTIEIITDPGQSELRIGILDNGLGMTEDELFAAMRLGSRNPLEQRSVLDLGRFGLGLKTASFSQCRKVTVLTRIDGKTSVAVWDLEFVADTNDWLVQIPDDLVNVPWADRLGASGTLVIWEKLDRVVEPDGTEKGLTHFVRRMDEAREHLELVFHRFLSGERSLKKVAILLNNRALEPYDPFHSLHPATTVEPLTPEIIKVGDQEVTIQTFTLPHHRKVTPQEWDRYAGRAGYLKNQGFYVYRQKRLIIHGTWFGLTRQNELTKLTRVRIDMPNGLDAEWKIDVKKASAQPPYQVRERLRRIIETIGATSKRVYTSRGRTLVTDSRLPVWNRVQDKNEIFYRINSDHPVLADFRDRLTDDLKRDFSKVVELFGSALPMDALFADLGGAPEKVSGNTMSEDALGHTVITTVTRLRESGIPMDDMITMLKVTEPFRSNWQLTEEILINNLSEERLNGGQSRKS
ncbi:ATP-binding protein [Bradyrhizobium sp.]